jgi:hypothetical protein
MKETRRWLESDNASSQVLDVLRHAEAPGALDRATRERSRRRVAALGVMPALGATLLLQQAALGALLGSAVVAAVVVAPRLFSGADSAPRAPAAQPSGRAISRGVPAAHTSKPAAPAVVDAVEPPREGKANLASRPAPPAAILPGDAASEGAEAPDLVREARALENVRRSIESDPAGALRALAAHELEFGSGALALEREFLSITALVRLGRLTEAESRAKRLRARAPGSLYEQRLERLLETPKQ